MPIIRFKEITAMSAADRTIKLYELRAELTRIRTMINAGGRVDDSSRVRELRKVIAQILTVQNEEKLGIRKAAAQPEPKAEKPAKKAVAKKETKEKVPQ